MRVYVGCSKRKEWWAFLSPLIRWADKFPASHFYIRFETRTIEGPRSIIKESVWPESRTIDKLEWDKSHIVVQEWELDYRPLGQREFFAEYMGKKYSFLQLFVILAQFIYPAFSLMVNDKKYLICTEMVARWLNKFYGVEFKESFDTISMRELYREVRRISKES